MADQQGSEYPAAVAAGLEQFFAVSSIFDAVEMVLYVADMETYEVLFFNAHAEQLWGRNSVGKLCYQVLQAGQDRPCAFCTNPVLIKDGRACPPVVWEFQNTVNQRWYLCIDKAIPWTDGRLVRMEVAIDITERKGHEQFREQYVSVISHDLRTPLSGISHWASVVKLLMQRYGVTEGEEPVNAILRNVRRMSDMTEDLLETTRLESGQLQLQKTRFDLAELAGVVIDHLAAETRRRIHLEVCGPALVLADAARVERVLANLVGNAIRYSAHDTLVTVQVATEKSEALVKVADSGVGIPADELPKLFQRFYRASTSSDVKDGIGLGLYNSRLIIEHHGGTIWAESDLGAGSTFGFALPVAPPDC